jgi:hypothetical protein
MVAGAGGGALIASSSLLLSGSGDLTCTCSTVVGMHESSAHCEECCNVSYAACKTQPGRANHSCNVSCVSVSLKSSLMRGHCFKGVLLTAAVDIAAAAKLMQSLSTRK